MFKKLANLFGTKEQSTTSLDENTHQSVAVEALLSPMNGQLKPLTEVNDPAFAQGAMGDGIAIEPAEGKVYSPVNGVIANTPKSKHSLLIISEHGAEILIHVGIDTVKLKGEHFNVPVTLGQQIKAGDLIIEFEIEAIKQSGYEVTTPVIITNTANYSKIDKVVEYTNAVVGHKILHLTSCRDWNMRVKQ
ncbi:PTS glucose transporter subunit IIA [Paenibacillus peoriae]|uniref:PTS sugar transporter subunit IIA n=1 Tax=Paenibacillus peoriae TaxID=59893 RepID=UPI0030CF0C03